MDKLLDQVRSYDQRVRRISRLAGCTGPLEYVGTAFPASRPASLRYEGGELKGFRRSLRIKGTQVGVEMLTGVPFSMDLEEQGKVFVHGQIMANDTSKDSSYRFMPTGIEARGKQLASSQIGIYERLYAAGFTSLPLYLRTCLGGKGLAEHLKLVFGEKQEKGTTATTLCYQLNDLLLKDQILALANREEDSLRLTLKL